MTKKDRKRRQQELLGMSMSSAEKKLRKAIIHEFARQLGRDVCLECGLPIEDPDELAVKHVEDWEGDPDQFFDLTNVAFGHVSCGAGGHGQRQEEESEMRKVEVVVEDENEVPLRGCRHRGQVYVAGEKDQRYQVRVRNATSRRLLVVVTVDGRNVNTGKPGTWDDSGHVLEPFGSWVFKGWRQTDDRVAAFRLGTRDDSYSAQMGSAENVGVIGVAVFEEKQPERPIITVKEKEYVPVPYPVSPWPRLRPWDPWDPWRPTWIATPTTTDGTGVRGVGDLHLGGATYSTSASCSLGSEPAQFTSDSLSLGSLAESHEQALGTEYGETVASVVRKATFARATDAPCELHELRYDSLDALVEAGIMGRRPSQKRRRAPRAFPEAPEVSDGYCAPPPRRREYKP